MVHRKKKKITVLATGGTIAGTGRDGLSTGYQSGALPAEELIRAVPGIEELADLEIIQVCSINSDDVTDRIWIRLAGLVDSLSADPETDGIVILHGTDTIEETAYFLHLTVRTEKPVILTGSMRPSTARSADGPMNLYEAVAAAVADQSAGQGVLLVFSGRILSARFARKTCTDSAAAITGGEQGALGSVSDRSVAYYQTPSRRHTLQSEFAPCISQTLPQVSILLFHTDADPSLLQHAAENAEGIVIAGAGAGEFSQVWAGLIRTLEMPVVISSGVRSGRILQESLLCGNTVSAQDLTPQKAAVLLRLALQRGLTRQEELIRIFSEY